jgi:hypothetical protein
MPVAGRNLRIALSGTIQSGGRDVQAMRIYTDFSQGSYIMPMTATDDQNPTTERAQVGFGPLEQWW